METDIPQTLKSVTLDSADVPSVELAEVTKDQLADAQVAVPEFSHTGESQSNGFAERAVQQWEDHFRTSRATLEANFNTTIDITHPIFTWLVQRARYLLSQYIVGLDWRTGLGRLHGRELNARICEFGEHVMYYMPKAQRSKMEVRWRYAIFVGRSYSSDQNNLIAHDGSTVRARAMVRVVPQTRWDKNKLLRTTQTPLSERTLHESLIEEHPEQHMHVPTPGDDNEPSNTCRVKNPAQNPNAYVYSDHCPRCGERSLGNHKRANFLKRSETCRRITHARLRADGSLTIQLADGDHRTTAQHQSTTTHQLQPTANNNDEQHTEAGLGEHVFHPDNWDEDKPQPPSNPDDVRELADEVAKLHPAQEEDNDHQMLVLMDCLQTLGVTTENACQFSTSIIKDTRAKHRFQSLHDRLDATRTYIATITSAKPTFIEIFGRGGLVEASHGLRRNLNVHGLDALDLRTCKESGEPWDFSKPADRQEALHLVRTRRPSWIVGSPPCTAFSQLNGGHNVPKLPKERVDKIIEERRMHLHFVIVLYKLQLGEGRHFLHEHPRGGNQLDRFMDAQVTLTPACYFGNLRPMRIRTYFSHS